MGQPISKSDIARARRLCLDALADVARPVGAKWIEAWWHRSHYRNQKWPSIRAIQCALRSLFINGYVDRQRSGNGYVYTRVIWED